MTKKNIFRYLQVLLLVFLTILFVSNATSCAGPITGTILDSQMDENENPKTDDNPDEGGGSAGICVYFDGVYV